MRTLKLEKPATAGERTINELTFEEPTVGHMVSLDRHETKNGYGADISLTASLTGEPESIISNISPEDWVRVSNVLAEVYGRFMGISPEELKELEEDTSPPDQGEAGKASSESSENV